MNTTIITDLTTQLSNAPIVIVVAFSATIIGIYLKKCPHVNNNYIPLIVLIMCSVGYGILGDTMPLMQTQKYPHIVLGMYGLIVGFFVWGTHKALFKKLEKFLPDGMFPKEWTNGNTQIITNPNPPEPVNKP